MKLEISFVLGAPETDDQQRLRFQIELEFVQCLANPNYLNCKQNDHCIFQTVKKDLHLR